MGMLYGVLLSIIVVAVIAQDSTTTVVVVGKAEEPDVSPEKVSVTFTEEGRSVQRDIPMELQPYAEKLTAETAAALEQSDNTQGAFIVAFKENIKQSKKDKLLAKAQDVQDLGSFRGTKLRAKVKDVTEILQDPDVQYVEVDQDVALAAAAINDEIPFGVQDVHAPTAWNETLGQKVRIALLDSGIAPHKDLKIAGGVAIVGKNYGDTNGHGTQVAGVIAAELNGKGIVGNAPKAELYAVRITEGEQGKLSDAIIGLQWAIDNHMDIASMSFGFASYSQIFKEKVQEAYGKGMILIASSGNDGAEQILYPAKYSKVVAVGAVNKEHGKADFSNYGDDLELVAPGVAVQTTTLNNGYTKVDGTSFATPHVAGVAALIKARYPMLTPGQIRQKLRRDALDVELPGFDILTGYGLAQFVFGAENLTEVDDRYHYTIYTVSVEKGENVLTYWTEGYGTIDDVHFAEGEYSLVKNFSGRIVQEDMDVSENQTFHLLSRSIDLFDNFTQNGSTSSDGIAWKDGVLNASIIKEPSDNAEVACWDWQNDGLWDDCFANLQTTMNQCRDNSSYLTSICTTCNGDEEKNCAPAACSGSGHIYSGAVGAKHIIKKDVQNKNDTDPVTQNIVRSDIDAHYYYNCFTNAKIRGFALVKQL